MAPPRLTLSHNRLCGRLRTSAGGAKCAPDPIRRALTRLEGRAKGNLVGVRAVDNYERGAPGGNKHMAERALRGPRLGATSYENDRNTDLAPRQEVAFDCPK